MMGTTESWIYGTGGAVFFDIENDGPAVARKGLRARDYPVSTIYGKYYYTFDGLFGGPIKVELSPDLVAEADAVFSDENSTELGQR
jgi:hypothetical protein